MRHCFLLVVAALLATAARAQSPRLTVPGAPEGTVFLERAAVQVEIDGPLAQVTQTLTFRSTSERVLEGELLVPLPEGATIGGYALDSDGVLVEAVPVPKEQARMVFEEEVRRGVDPGLAEQVSGNVFRLRVYPLPAKGRRTVRVVFSTELRARGEEARLTVPLRFGAPIPQATVTVESDRPAAATLADAPLEWGQQRARRRASLTVANLAPTDLQLLAPAPERPLVRVDSFRPEGARAAERYFVVALPPVAPPAGLPTARPRPIGLLWDASLSRRNADRTRELALLGAFLARIGEATVVVTVVRETAAAGRSFAVRGGDSKALRAFLNGLPLDGGTDLSALRVPAGVDLCLLFTDGNDSLGRGLSLAGDGAPLFAIASDARANHALLRHLASTRGGAYLNLTALTDAQAQETLGAPPFGLRRIVVTPPDAVAGLQRSPDGAVLTGRLLRPAATLTLGYGVGQKIVATRTAAIDGTTTSSSGRIARYCAQRYAEALALEPERNRAALTALGRRFGIVTPGTSLLVLETLEQHLRYRIPPPRSRPALYDAYLGRVQTAAKAEKRKDAQQRERLVREWREQVRWWEKSRRFPAGFRRDPPKPRHVLSRTAGLAAMTTQVSSGSAPSIRATRPPSPHEGREMVLLDVAGGAGRARLGAVIPSSSQRTAPASAAPRVPSIWGLRLDLDAKDDRTVRGSTVELPDPRVAIQAWSPDAPYAKALRAARPETVYAAYLKARGRYGAMPGFYLDCAELLRAKGRFVEAVRVLTSLTDLEIENVALLRIVARRLQQLGQLRRAIPLFARIRRLRPDEPQSLRDLALAYDAGGDPVRALALLNEILVGRWNRAESDFQGIEKIVLVEANRIAARLPAGAKNPLDRRLRRNLEVDLRLVLDWDTDQTDMDLHVIEPSGEECFYGNPRTAIGGRISNDFTNGYGPEEYLLRFAMPGRYRIKAHFFGSRAQRLTGPTTLQASVITHFGRPNERRRTLTLRLTGRGETYAVGECLLP